MNKRFIFLVILCLVFLGLCKTYANKENEKFCLKYSSQGFCTKCKEGYFVKDICTNVFNDNEMIVCGRHRLESYKGSTCEPFPYGCQVVFSSGICESCYKGYMFNENNECIPKK